MKQKAATPYWPGGSCISQVKPGIRPPLDFSILGLNPHGHWSGVCL